MLEAPYNPLPEDKSVYDGPNRRRTDFDSPEAKLAYDAEQLFSMAQTHLEKKLPTVDEVLDFSERADDDPDALAGAIGSFRKGYIRQLKSPPNFEAFVKGLELSEVSREKLKAMLSPEAYALSLSAYREMGGTKEAPSLDAIRAEIMKWSIDRLRLECEMREQPTLLIVSDRSFDEGIASMDANKHYRNDQGTQRDAYVNRGSESPYVGAPKFSKHLVTIEEGVPNPKRPEGLPVQLKAGRDHLAAIYEQAGMSHIPATRMQALKQRSLIQAEEKGDMSLVVDNWEGGYGTATFLELDSLTKSRLVAFSDFSSYYRKPDFLAGNPADENDNLRGRASAQVMEF